MNRARSFRGTVRQLLAHARMLLERAQDARSPEPSASILFVCKGNICRSPLACGLLEKRAAELGLRLRVEGAATSDRTQGRPPHPNAVRCARSHGFSIAHFRARTFSPRDFDFFDRIYAMDAAVLDELRRCARRPQDLEKVQHFSVDNADVFDPIDGGPDVFEAVYEHIAAQMELRLRDLKARVP